MTFPFQIYTSKENVNVQEFKAFCQETYTHILNDFSMNNKKWINITPTVHALLAHSWELISLNNECRLGHFTEGGLENSNKFLRFYRRNMARKVNQEANLEDCITRLWIRSDPLIRDTAPKPTCTRCKTEGHFTVSCPLKSAKVFDSTQTLDDYFLSLLLAK